MFFVRKKKKGKKEERRGKKEKENKKVSGRAQVERVSGMTGYAVPHHPENAFLPKQSPSAI